MTSPQPQISGVGRYLKEQNPDIKVVGVDIEGSLLEHYFRTGEMSDAYPYLIEGIGEDFVPTTLSFDFVDEIVTVNDPESFHMARRLSREEGIFVGGSCGSAVAGAMQIADREGPGKRLVVLLPDHGNRYLSTFHGDEWMLERGFVDPAEMSVADIVAQKPPGAGDLVTAAPGESVRVVLERMREKHVSQVPVLDGLASVGSLEEGIAMARVLENASLLDAEVRELMGDPYPCVPADAPMSSALEPLSNRKTAVLVTDDGDITGLLTRFDFLKFIHAK